MSELAFGFYGSKAEFKELYRLFKILEMLPKRLTDIMLKCSKCGLCNLPCCANCSYIYEGKIIPSSLIKGLNFTEATKAIITHLSKDLEYQEFIEQTH